MTDRQSTHAPDCWGWGAKHYECAVREIERLRKMHQDAYQRGLQAGSKGLREMYDAVQAVKRQDAWGNAQLTEALMEAEERAERAEAENKQLRAEVGELHMHAKRRDQYAVEKAAQALDWKKRADQLAKALEEIRSRTSMNLAMHPNPFELTALLGDIYQIADAALGKEADRG